MPQICRARKRAAQVAAASLIVASADAAGMSAAAVAGSSSSAAAAAPTSSRVAGPAASAKGVADVDMAITITYGILPHRDKLRGMMWEAFTSEEMLDSNVVLDTGVFDFLVWTLTALEFYETMPPLGCGYLLAQQPPTASPAEENAGRPLKDILSDIFEMWPNLEFIEHGVNIGHSVQGLTAQARGATKTYVSSSYNGNHDHRFRRSPLPKYSLYVYIMEIPQKPSRDFVTFDRHNIMGCVDQNVLGGMDHLYMFANLLHYARAYFVRYVQGFKAIQLFHPYLWNESSGGMGGVRTTIISKDMILFMEGAFCCSGQDHLHLGWAQRCAQLI